ncbi:hypothetical protein EOD39_21563 [Acipenser ruthenus]|uniref:Uncharacterized protein n=1 Tax=Acipenser ruthenus TaxID=7906 RepID=A0A444USB3_ACIRT|nr:hypothetical protein EOD39_21563 [Acipenser ruthenus]
MEPACIKVEPPEPEPVSLKQEPEPAHAKEDLPDPVHLKEEAGELRLVHVKVETAEDHAQEDPFESETVRVKTEEESEDVSEADPAGTSQGCIAESMNDLGLIHVKEEPVGPSLPPPSGRASQP